MEFYQYIIIIAIIVLLLGFTVYVIYRTRDRKTKLPSTSAILTALDEDNIESVEFVRHKIVVKVKKASDANLQALKKTGAVGINVVGNKIKFYYEENNEKIYEALKKHEGSGGT